MDVYVLGEAHGLEHLRAEHTAIPDLDPFPELRVEGEDFQGGLCTNIIVSYKADKACPMRIQTSVYGLYAGLNRRFSIPIFLKKTRMKPGSQPVSRIDLAPLVGYAHQ